MTEEISNIFSNVKPEKEYIEESREDMKFDLLSFKNYLFKLGELKIKWSEYLYNEQRYVDYLVDKLGEVYKELYKYYLYKQTDDKVSVKDVEIYIKGDKEYMKYNKIYKRFVDRVGLVERVLKNLENQSFVANTLLKYEMWQSGSNS